MPSPYMCVGVSLVSLKYCVGFRCAEGTVIQGGVHLTEARLAGQVHIPQDFKEENRLG